VGCAADCRLDAAEVSPAVASSSASAAIAKRENRAGKREATIPYFGSRSL
jgi:hypothetical protein